MYDVRGGVCVYVLGFVVLGFVLTVISNVNLSSPISAAI